MKQDLYKLTTAGIILSIITSLIAIFLLGVFIYQKIPRYEIVEKITFGVSYDCDYGFKHRNYKECYCEEIKQDNSYCGDTEITPEKDWGLMTEEEQDSICAHYYYEGFKYYRKYSTHIIQHICYIKEKIRTN